MGSAIHDMYRGRGTVAPHKKQGVQFTKFGYAFKHTFGRIFNKKETSDGAISPFQAMCTALAGTVGTGNIAGVAGAIAIGGPGAVFWMWISALLGMSTKACEIILGQRYRVKYKNSMDEYMCDRSFVMKNALGWKKEPFCLQSVVLSLDHGHVVYRQNPL